MAFLRIFSNPIRCNPCYVAFFYIGFLLLDCAGFSTRSLPELSFQVREQHRKILLLLTQEKYRSEELENVFQEMKTKGDEFCNMYYRNIPFRAKWAKNFLGNYNSPPVENREWYSNVLHSVVSGCFNFFKMNDLKVQDTMEKISKHYPGSKECYSVGFMQPYFMHNAMGCSRLTMLDADWRIHYAHYRLLQGFFRNQETPNPVPVEELLVDLPVQWVGQFKSKPKMYEKIVNLDTFCNKEDREECKNALVGFQSKISHLSDVELQLAFLHDAHIKLKNLKIAILYASNALDNEYTKKKDYLVMMENYKKSLQADQKIVMIYKSGGTSVFGVYELQLDSRGELVVTTTCRDNYIRSQVYKQRGKPYSIYLDKLSSSGSKPPTCEAFLK